MKQILFAALCALLFITSCNSPENKQEGTMTFKRADISGAEFLTLASSGDAQTFSKSTTETSRLYKIDENGNMTTVVFYIEIDIDGNKTTEQSTEDIEVTPTKIIDYGKEYMLFDNCSIDYITDKYRRFYNGQSSRDFLVRKSDGAIFELTYDQLSCFPDIPSNNFSDFISSMQITYNSRGELYMVGRSPSYAVSKLKLENEKLLLQQLTTGINSYKIMLDQSDNLFVLSSNVNGGYIYFSDGGVAQVEGYDEVLLIDNHFYKLEIIITPISTQYKLSKINPHSPNLAYEQVAISPETDVWLPDFHSIIEAESKVLFLGFSYQKGLILVYDKSTYDLSLLSIPQGFNDLDYNSQGVAYSFSSQDLTQITKYNIIDMTKQTINCDRGAVPPFIQTATQQNSTDFFEFGIKNSNGAPIRVHTNLETGKVVVHEGKDDRKVTELIKVS